MFGNGTKTRRTFNVLTPHCGHSSFVTESGVEDVVRDSVMALRQNSSHAHILFHNSGCTALPDSAIIQNSFSSTFSFLKVRSARYKKVQKLIKGHSKITWSGGVGGRTIYFWLFLTTLGVSS